MTSIIAYVISFFVAPIVSSLAGLVFSPLVAFFPRSLSFLPIIVIFAIMGFAAIGIGQFIFSLLGLQATWILVLVMGIAYLFNNANRLRNAGEHQFYLELFMGASELLGLVAGGFYWIR